LFLSSANFQTRIGLFAGHFSLGREINLTVLDTGSLLFTSMAHVVDAHGVSLDDALAMLRALPAYDQQQRPALLARFFSAPTGGETTLPRHLTAEVTALQTAQLLEIGTCRFFAFSKSGRRRVFKMPSEKK
jgi:hypothetical protein